MRNLVYQLLVTQFHLMSLKSVGFAVFFVRSTFLLPPVSFEAVFQLPGLASISQDGFNDVS